MADILNNYVGVTNNIALCVRSGIPDANKFEIIVSQDGDIELPEGMTIPEALIMTAFLMGIEKIDYDWRTRDDRSFWADTVRKWMKGE